MCEGQSGYYGRQLIDGYWDYNELVIAQIILSLDLNWLSSNYLSTYPMATGMKSGLPLDGTHLMRL